MPSIQDRFQPLLTERQANHLQRQRPLLSSPQQPKAQLNGREVINFASNDYLGLSNHPEITGLSFTATGYGAGAAHLLTGHHLEHHLLEDEIADWLNVESALLFSTGYMANLAVQQTLMQKGDWILADKLNHASLIDGARYSDAELKRFPHNDMSALERRLVQAQQSHHQTMIVTDGVFSMDGDLAKLPEILRLQQRYHTWLLVDDAHGFGVMGANGKGTFEHYNLQPNENTILMGTLGKAFGTFGAFVAGSQILIDTLIQFARPYIYTTAMPVANALAARKALNLLQTETALLSQLKHNIQYFQQQIQTTPLPLSPSQSAIQILLIGDSEKALEWANSLKDQGIWVSAIRPPTVAHRSARLRITLSSSHTQSQIDQLIDALIQAHQQHPLPTP